MEKPRVPGNGLNIRKRGGYHGSKRTPEREGAKLLQVAIAVLLLSRAAINFAKAYATIKKANRKG